MGLSATINYMVGVLTNHKSAWNMYLHGAAVLTAIRIAIASTGATFSIVEGSVAATTDFSIMAIETFMPIFISLEKGLAGFEEMITIFVMNTMIGTVLSGLKYGIAT